MKIVPSVNQELESLRQYAKLLAPDAPAEQFADPKVREFSQLLDLLNGSARATFEETNQLRGQVHLDGAYAELAWAWDAVKNAARRNSSGEKSVK